ncbi:MAG: hypothetical protein ACW964_14660, partial [Candidatus Hodarchaeales archaeon]
NLTFSSYNDSNLGKIAVLLIIVLGISSLNYLNLPSFMDSKLLNLLILFIEEKLFENGSNEF